MQPKRKKRIRVLLIVAVALVIIVVLALLKTGTLGADDALQVQYTYPSRQNITQLTTANGRIQPVFEVKISPEVSGEIIELPVVEGQSVKKGDLLCRIKPDVYQSMREQYEASLSQTIARAKQSADRLTQVKLSYDRTKKLYEQKAVSEADFEKATAEYEVAVNEEKAARFAVESSRASLKEATENLRKTTIYAPSDGTISLLSVELGERVVGTAQMAGTEILRLADLNRMEARVNVSESDIVNVHLGDTAIVSVDAYPDSTFRGVVTQVANSAKSATSADQITNFEVRIFLLKNTYQWLVDQGNPIPFKPGMSVSVDIMTAKVYDVLSLPIEAVGSRNDSLGVNTSVAESQTAQKPLEVVFLADGDTARMQVVKTGIQNSEFIEIRTKLDDSARVIVSPYSAVARELKQGALIKASRKNS